MILQEKKGCHWQVRPRDGIPFSIMVITWTTCFFFNLLFFTSLEHPWSYGPMVNWWSSPIQVRISVALRQMFGCIRWAIFANQTSMVRTGPKSASIIGRKSAWRTSDYSDYWIGLRENLHETMVFTIKYRDFLYFFPSSNSMKWSIYWLWELWFTRILVMYSRWLRCFTIFLPGFITVFHELSSGQTSLTINKHIYEYLVNDIINKHHIINHHSTIININKHVSKL